MNKSVLIATALLLASSAGLAQAQPGSGTMTSPSPRAETFGGNLVLADARSRHAAPKHWAKGQRLDNRYRNNRIGNHKRLGLRAPGRGHHWVRVGSQYLLINDASGRIAGIMRAR
ncbi:RcnB family protein [Fulvimarina endophytica]|nr:RcnB family protein [Fulvimarina endophytica]